MKTPLFKTLIVIALVGFSGCTTNYQAAKVTEGKFTRHGYISVTSEKINDQEYRIVASGAAVSRVEDIERAWAAFAQKVAAGSSFKKESTVEPFSYYDPSSYMTFHAMRVVGKITITKEK